MNFLRVSLDEKSTDDIDFVVGSDGDLVDEISD